MPMLVCIPCYMNLITPCQCLLPSCIWHSWVGQDAWQRFVTWPRDRNRGCDPAQRTDHIHTETERENALGSVLQWMNTIYDDDYDLKIFWNLYWSKLFINTHLQAMSSWKIALFRYLGDTKARCWKSTKWPCAAVKFLNLRVYTKFR